MLNISGLNEGIVLDHIEAGKSLDIYYHLGLDKLECQVAIIKNARSSKMGRKDIIKIEGGLDVLDLQVLGYIDHNITVNIIQDNKIAEKKTLKLPKKITNALPPLNRNFLMCSSLPTSGQKPTAAGTVKKNMASESNAPQQAAGH